MFNVLPGTVNFFVIFFLNSNPAVHPGTVRPVLAPSARLAGKGYGYVEVGWRDGFEYIFVISN